LISDVLSVWCKWGWGVDTELLEHGGDVGGRGRGGDRSRTKDGGLSAEGAHGGEVDDGGNGDMNSGSIRVLLGKWDRGVSNGSCGIFVGKVTVAI
jgi:hypothetical protein